MNERTVLNGHWHYGFFSMSAVAATNVGDIVIFDEPNKNRKIVHMETYDLVNESTRFKAGKKVGEFRMGSAIVLVFDLFTQTIGKIYFNWKSRSSKPQAIYNFVFVLATTFAMGRVFLFKRLE
jgi:phosphatidylserine decarboxylase